MFQAKKTAPVHIIFFVCLLSSLVAAVGQFLSKGYRIGGVHGWAEGDFSGGRGVRGHPPAGDGLFDEDDIMAALVHGLFDTGPYTLDLARPNGVPSDAILVPGSAQDNQVGLNEFFIRYDANTGAVAVVTRPGYMLSSVSIEGDGDIFTLTRSPFKGAYDFVTSREVFVGSFSVFRETVQFGLAATAGLAENVLRASLRVRGTVLGPAGAGPVTEWVLDYVPVITTTTTTSTTTIAPFALEAGDVNLDGIFNGIDTLTVSLLHSHIRYSLSRLLFPSFYPTLVIDHWRNTFIRNEVIIFAGGAFFLLVLLPLPPSMLLLLIRLLLPLSYSFLTNIIDAHPSLRQVVFSVMAQHILGSVVILMVHLEEQTKIHLLGMACSTKTTSWHLSCMAFLVRGNTSRILRDPAVFRGLQLLSAPPLHR